MPVLNFDTDAQLDALDRLWKIANGHSGQCKVVAAFLLGLYNGLRFPFDLTSLRALDEVIFEDCLLVLNLDNRPVMEVHRHLGVKSEAFELLAKDWGITGLQMGL